MAACLAATGANCARVQRGAPQAAAVIVISDAQHASAECHLSIAPDGKRLAAAWMSNTRGEEWSVGSEETSSTVAYALSLDEGRSWTPAKEVPVQESFSAFDPVVASDATGRFFLAWLVSGPKVNESAVMVSVAAPGSTDFSMPVEVTQHESTRLFDKPWIVVTPGGRVVVTYHKGDAGNNGPMSVMAAHSDDGRTWQLGVVASSARYDNVVGSATACASPSGGIIWVAYLKGESFDVPFRVEVVRSEDGGETWSSVPLVVSRPNERVALDPFSCVCDDEGVWVSYGVTDDPPLGQDLRVQKLSGIEVVRIKDGGNEVAGRVDVLARDAGPFAMHPQIALSPSGSPHVFYYGGRRGGDLAGRLVWVSVTQEMRITNWDTVAEPIVFVERWGDRGWFGDYLGVVGHQYGIGLCYVDNSGTRSVVVYRSLTELSGAGESERPR